MTFEEQTYEATQRVNGMDKIDGWKNRELDTILCALECGLRRPETGAHFDAYVMLKDIVDTAKGVAENEV